MDIFFDSPVLQELSEFEGSLLDGFQTEQDGNWSDIRLTFKLNETKFTGGDSSDTACIRFQIGNPMPGPECLDGEIQKFVGRRVKKLEAAHGKCKIHFVDGGIINLY